MTTSDALDRARESFGRRAWADACAQFAAADQQSPLEPPDLELLATAAHLLGRDDDSADVWARAYHELLRRDEPERAARCALWLASGLLTRAEPARAGNSGAEIAFEVARARPTWLSGPDTGHVPVRTGGVWDRLLTRRSGGPPRTC
jgi:hypothetical protein